MQLLPSIIITAHNNRSNDCQLVIQEPGLVNVTCLDGNLQWTKRVCVYACASVCVCAVIVLCCLVTCRQQHPIPIPIQSP